MSLPKWLLRTKKVDFLFKSVSMWTNISNHLAWHAKNAELELGGPRGFQAMVCVARNAELGRGGPGVGGFRVPRGWPVDFLSGHL